MRAVRDISESALDTLESEVIRRLALLAEGRAMDYDRLNLHRVHPGSTPPPGAHGASRGDLRPWLSLSAYHQELMNKAREKGLHARLRAIAEAEADYEMSIKRQPTFDSSLSSQNTEERDTAILVHFEGCRPEWPAAFMRCSASHVEKLRRRNGRDATLGERIVQTEAA